MNIYFDGVNFKSNRGKDSFAKKLSDSLIKKGYNICNNLDDSDVHLAVISNSVHSDKVPMVQRLDGIYFHSKMDNDKINSNIRKTYNKSDAVIFQSEFDKKVICNTFGTRENMHVIHNGTNYESIKKIQPDNRYDKFDNVWVCASKWQGRPNKRLKENIKYFLSHSKSNDCLVVAGLGDFKQKHDRVFYLGHIGWKQLISLYKRASYFIHLAIVDHCPNVVVDARACGCKIVCSSLGGTEEIAGTDSIVIEDMDWDFKTPFDYKNPPKLDFSKSRSGKYDNSVDIDFVSGKYLEVFNSLQI